MEQFFKDFSFIIGFMILTLIAGMAFGEKAQRWFLLIVLFGMAILQSEDVAKFMDKNFKVKE